MIFTVLTKHPTNFIESLSVLRCIMTFTVKFYNKTLKVKLKCLETTKYERSQGKVDLLQIRIKKVEERICNIHLNDHIHIKDLLWCSIKMVEKRTITYYSNLTEAQICLFGNKEDNDVYKRYYLRKTRIYNQNLISYLLVNRL